MPVPADAPRVSVITCVYNGERFLGPAIESVLAQTYTDFEYILVDDASTDGSPGIIAAYAGQDGRLIGLRNPVNLNPSGALNRALEVARGEYVAVLDQDDLAMPERLARQVAYLDAHPATAVVGAQVQKIDANDQPQGVMGFPTDPVLARWQILYRSPVLHSAAMMRRALVMQAGGYSLRQWYVNDYLLFSRLILTSQLTNLPDCLAAYRRSAWQTASVFEKQQLGQAILLIHSMVAERLGLRLGLPDLLLFYRGMRGGEQPDEAALLRAAEVLGQIHARYEQVEPMGAAVRDRVRQDCAWHWLVMAVVHHRAYRHAGQQILARAVGLDPHLWQQPNLWARLRRLRKAR